MEKLTNSQMNLITNVLGEIMLLHNEGKQIWFEFSPHTSWIEIHWFKGRDDLVIKTFRFNELSKAMVYINSIKSKIYNNY